MGSVVSVDLATMIVLEVYDDDDLVHITPLGQNTALCGIYMDEDTVWVHDDGTDDETCPVCLSEEEKSLDEDG